MCETWTLTEESEMKIQAIEMRSFQRLLGISYRDHVTNEELRNTIRHAIGPYEDFITTVSVRKRKLRWYEHKTKSTGLARYREGEGQADRKKKMEDVLGWT